MVYINIGRTFKLHALYTVFFRKGRFILSPAGESECVTLLDSKFIESGAFDPALVVLAKFVDCIQQYGI